MENHHQFEDVDTAYEYVLGGHGSITVVSKKTGKRYTYTFGQKEDSPVFVRAKYGAEYEDTVYIGCIRDNGKPLDTPFYLCKDDRVIKHPACKTFAWIWGHILHGARTSDPELLDHIEIWHEGKCGRCGRSLTVPESIAAGIGPVCAERI